MDSASPVEPRPDPADCDHCYRHNHDFDHPCCECGAPGVACPPGICPDCRLDQAECECEDDEPTDNIAQSVTCTTCRRTKAPIGRDVAAAAAGAYCDRECPGYTAEPHPGTRWPGEVIE